MLKPGCMYFTSDWCVSAVIFPNVDFSRPVEFMNLSNGAVAFGYDKRYGRLCERQSSLLYRIE